MSDIFSNNVAQSFGGIELNKPIIDIYNNLDFDSELDKQLYTDLKLASQRRVFHLTEPAKGNGVNLMLPFTENELIDYSGKIPEEMKINGLKQKYILKETFKDILPKSILTRPKEGFTAPFGLWFENNRDWVLEQFEEDGFFGANAKDYVAKIIDNKTSEYEDNMKVWILLNLSIWHKKIMT